jgi:hypothetical protein
MAIYDPTTPPMFISGTVTQVIGLDKYEYVDDTQIKFTGAYQTYEITVNTINYQTIGTAETRSGVAKKYNGLDIKAGDWITTTNGQIVMSITRIIEKTSSSARFEVKDIDMIVYKTYANSVITIGNKIAFFQVSDNRVPMIAGGDIAAFFNVPLAVDKIQGRFAAEEESERYRFEFDTPNTLINKGDIITIDKTNGTMVKFGSTNASEIPIGVVIEKIINNTVIYVKPFNTMVDNHTTPELLTGNAGDIYYAHPSNPGAMATTKYPGAQPLFLQVKNAIPTVVTATESNYLPTSADSLIINNTTVFDGNIHLVPNTIGDFTALINGSTSVHKVLASYTADFATVSSTAANSNIGVSALVVSDDSGATYNAVIVNFSDGTNSVQVTFDENTGAQLIPFPSAVNYLTYNASLIATVLNTEFTNAGVNLQASASLPGDGTEPTVYGILTIEATDPSASINITGADLDAFGNTFIGAMGIATTTPAQSFYYLVLTRADGGDILITGQGSYINTNGIASSSAGEAPILLMLEGVDKEQETGVSVGVDKNQTVIATTTHDHFVTGIDIDYTPFADSEVIVKINGVEINVGDGDTTEACYFTDPTDAGFNTNGDPMVPKAIADIASGDVLIWNLSNSGFQLDPSDDIDIVYDASSYDL